MPTTSPDGLTSPNSGDFYDAVADWASSMQNVQDALSNRGSKEGTTTERNAATNVREGTFWWDTTEDRLYRRNSTGAWIPAATETAPVEVDEDSNLVSSKPGTLRVFRWGKMRWVYGNVTSTNAWDVNNFDNLTAAVLETQDRPTYSSYGDVSYSESLGACVVTPQGAVLVKVLVDAAGAVRFSTSYIVV